MNFQDTDLLVRGEDGFGLYSSAILSPVENTPTIRSKSRNILTASKKSEVPSYLRDVRSFNLQSLPQKNLRHARNAVSGLAEYSESPSSHYMDGMIDRVWNQMEKRKSLVKNAKMNGRSVYVSMSPSVNFRKSNAYSSLSSEEKSPPTSRFFQYRSLFCDEKIEKVRIQTSVPDRRASFSKNPKIFNPHRFKQVNKNESTGDQLLPNLSKEKVRSCIFPEFPSP